MSRWLVSHFAPFNGAQTNSSAVICKTLRPEFPNLFFSESLPVSFKESWQTLEPSLHLNKIDRVLAFGQAEERKHVCLERVALNFIDASIADEAGEQPIDQEITVGGSDLWTNYPVRELLHHPKVKLSYSTGTFVCNFLYYRLLEWARKNDKQALFVHVPAEVDGETVSAIRSILGKLT